MTKPKNSKKASPTNDVVALAPEGVPGASMKEVDSRSKTFERGDGARFEKAKLVQRRRDDKVHVYEKLKGPRDSVDLGALVAVVPSEVEGIETI